MILEAVISQLANRINQPHVIEIYLKKEANAYYKLGQEDAIKNSGWQDFSTTLPKAGQEILIVWPSRGFPPERRVLTDQHLKEDWTGIRWMPIPAYL